MILSGTTPSRHLSPIPTGARPAPGANARATDMTRRPGMTMTEVLVTIFVVVIGLTGVMSKFPFAAKQMSDALISDRSTSLATSTDGLVRGYWTEKVVENPANNEPFWLALDNPGGGLAAPQPN